MSVTERYPTFPGNVSLNVTRYPLLRVTVTVMFGTAVRGREALPGGDRGLNASSSGLESCGDCSLNMSRAEQPQPATVGDPKRMVNVKSLTGGKIARRPWSFLGSVP
jgi:hypothetical protein